MGVATLPAIVAGLVAAGGMPLDTPAAVQSGTLDAQRQVVATLGALAAEITGAGLGSPAIVVIGDSGAAQRVPRRLGAARGGLSAGRAQLCVPGSAMRRRSSRETAATFARLRLADGAAEVAVAVDDVLEQRETSGSPIATMLRSG